MTTRPNSDPSAQSWRDWLVDYWPMLLILMLAGLCFVDSCQVTISINNAPTAQGKP